MSGPTDAIAEGDYQAYDETIDRTITFRPVELERDLLRLHDWLTSEHVRPYWQLPDSLSEFRAKMIEKCNDSHLTPYIGSLNHVPMSYWECYWAENDVLAEYCETKPADQGIHLLIGPPEYLGAGYATSLVRAVLSMQFTHPATERVLTEPDVRNDRVIHVFERCGFEPVREIELPEKDALVMACSRNRFQSLQGVMDRA